MVIYNYVCLVGGESWINELIEQDVAHRPWFHQRHQGKLIHAYYCCDCCGNKHNSQGNIIAFCCLHVFAIQHGNWMISKSRQWNGWLVGFIKWMEQENASAEKTEITSQIGHSKHERKGFGSVISVSSLVTRKEMVVLDGTNGSLWLWHVATIEISTSPGL